MYRYMCICIHMYINYLYIYRYFIYVHIHSIHVNKYLCKHLYLYKRIFIYNTISGLFYCFPCATSGDIFNFVQKFESCNFEEYMYIRIHLKLYIYTHLGLCLHVNLYLYTHLGLFYCFSCATSGDIFNFVQKFESCNFQEAAQHIIRIMKLDIILDGSSRESGTYE
jgi:hypothetical protein